MIDRANPTETDWDSPADSLKDMAHQLTATAREQLAEANERLKDYVVREPVRAMGIALGLGVLLGWMIKRR